MSNNDLLCFQAIIRAAIHRSHDGTNLETGDFSGFAVVDREDGKRYYSVSIKRKIDRFESLNEVKKHYQKQPALYFTLASVERVTANFIMNKMSCAIDRTQLIYRLLPDVVLPDLTHLKGDDSLIDLGEPGTFNHSSTPTNLSLRNIQ